MKVTLEKLPASQVSFEIEVEGAKSQAIYDRNVLKLTKNAEIPGFRKGKAPKQLILRQFGVTQLKAGVLEDLIEESLTQALKDHREEVKPIGQFQMRSPLEEIVASFEIGKPLTFQAAIDVEPEVSLAQYQGLTVQVEKVEPKLGKVDKLLEDFQFRRATLIPVEDRPAQLEDEVTISYIMLDADTSEEIPDEADDNDVMLLEVDMNQSDFAFNIIGMNLGETKDIPMVLDEEMWDEPLGGKSVIYRTMLKEIKMNELPALDDEFAQAISEKQTMAELREFLEEREITAAAKETESNVTTALLNALVNNLEVEIPETMIDDEVNFLIRQQINYLNSKPEMQRLVNQIFTKENMPGVVETAKPEANVRVKRSLVIIKVAELEKIEPTPEEIELKLQEVLEDLQDQKKIDLEKLRDMLKGDLTSEKVVKWLEQNNQIEFVPEGSLTPAELVDEELENLSLNASNAEILIEAEEVYESTDVLSPDTPVTETLVTEILVAAEAVNEVTVAPEIPGTSKNTEAKPKSKKAKN